MPGSNIVGDKMSLRSGKMPPTMASFSLLSGATGSDGPGQEVRTCYCDFYGQQQAAASLLSPLSLSCLCWLGAHTQLRDGCHRENITENNVSVNLDRREVMYRQNCLSD